MALHLKEIIEVADPDIDAMASLMLATFADPNIVLSGDRIREFVGRRVEPDRSFHVLLVKDGDRVVGGTIFSYLPGSNCGFSEYMVLHQDYRGKGLGRLLFNGRKEVLDREARERGLPGAYGLFIEVENPDRTPAEYVERERETAMDAVDRWRLWHRMGFFRTSVPYVQPPLGAGKEPIYYMDLFFVPWDAAAQESRQIPRHWVFESVTPVWRGWVPDQYQEFLRWMDQQLGNQPVRLIPLFPES